MYSPRTFFDDSDSSPPNSPAPKLIPTFHLSPAPGPKAERSEHRRWNSLARPKPHPLPFSYEYIFEEGKLAGLAEYHPEQDFLHYSSSRGSSRTNSRNPSRRTSFEHSTRSSTDTRYSHESERSHGVPPSPRTTDKIKRALSLSRTRGRRTSSDDHGRTPSPAPRPQGIGLEFLTTALPKEPKTTTRTIVPTPSFESPRPAPSPKMAKRPEPITVPMPSPASVPLPFESPRAAPQPPQRQAALMPKSVPAPVVAHHTELMRKGPTRKDPKNNGLGITRPRELPSSVEGKDRSFQGPKRSTFINPALERAYTEPMMSGALQPETVVARPELRRKTSKFIEHLDDKPIQIEVEHEMDSVPAMPFIPPFDFMLPTLAAQNDPPQVARSERKSRPMIKRSQTVARRDLTYTHPEWPSLMSTPPAMAESTLPARTIPRFALGPRTQPFPNHIVRKRSASNMKASAESVKSASTTNLKRSTSMRTRPSAMWADVRMAEVKPTLMSPVVASGHARMISC